MFASHPRHRYVKEPALDSNRCESSVNLGVQGDFKEWLKVPRTTKHTEVFTVLVELLIPPPENHQVWEPSHSKGAQTQRRQRNQICPSGIYIRFMGCKTPTAFVMHPVRWFFNQTGVIKTNLAGNGANLFQTAKPILPAAVAAVQRARLKIKPKSPGSGKLDHGDLLIAAHWRRWQRWRCVVKRRAQVRGAVNEQMARGAGVKPINGTTLRQIIVILIQCLACNGMPLLINSNFQAVRDGENPVGSAWNGPKVHD